VVYIQCRGPVSPKRDPSPKISSYRNAALLYKRVV